MAIYSTFFIAPASDPRFNESQPHWRMKNLTTDELAPLVRIVTDWEDAKMTPIGIGSGALDAFPPEFIDRLRTADEFSIRRIAQEWAKVMSTPQYTHSVTGKRVEEDWTVETALSVLEPVIELAKKCGDGELVYLLVET